MPDSEYEPITTPEVTETPENARVRLNYVEHARDVMSQVSYNILEAFVPQYLWDNPDPIIQTEGAKGLVLYEDMTLDPVIDAAWQARQNPLLGYDWDIVAAGEDPEDIRDAKFIEMAFKNLNSSLWRNNSYMGGMSAFIYALSDAIRMGFSCPQAIWNVREARIVEMLHEVPQAFSFFDGSDVERASALYLNNWTGKDLFYYNGRDVQPQKAEPFKFVHAVYRPTYGNPYGRSCLRAAYWPYLFGFLQGMRDWATFVGKWAWPTLVGWLDEEDWADTSYRDSFRSYLSRVQSSYVTTLPRRKDAPASVEFLEPQRSSTHSVFDSYIATMNRLKCMAIVGAPLVLMEAEFGTRAQAQVQANVRADFLKGDADFIMQAMQVPIRWMIDLRFGKRQPKIEQVGGVTLLQPPKYPTFKLHYEPPQDLVSDIAVDEKLNGMIKLPASYFYEHYGRPQPKVDPKTKEEEPLAERPPAPAPGMGMAAGRASSAQDEEAVLAELPLYRDLVMKKNSKTIDKFIRTGQ